MDTDSSNIWQKIFLTDGYCISPYTCKRCTAFKQFDGLNFDSLAWKRQKRQNFTPVEILRYMVCYKKVLSQLCNNEYFYLGGKQNWICHDF